MATSMDDILNDKPEEPEKTEAPAPETPEPQAKAEAPEAPERAEGVQSKRKEHQRKEWEAQGRDPETGQFVAKEKVEEQKAEAKTEPAKTAAPPAPAKEEMTSKERAAFAKAADETRKRQALEVEIARLRQAAAPQQPAATTEKAKTFWDDPEGALKAHQEQTHRTAIQTRLQTAEMLGRSRHTDFDEKIAKFAELASSTPGLGQQMISAADPAEFAYMTAKNHIDIQQAGGVEKLIAEREVKARADERAKVEAELKAKSEEAERKRAALPPSLTGVHGAGRKPSVAWTGPTAMDDILKH